jgi:O-antigen/teichoic acid export membrane protein
MSEIRKLFQSTLVYGATNTVISGAKFLLIPVYAHYLSSVQYGYLGTANTIGALAVTFGLFGLERSVAREYFDYLHDKASLSTYFRTLLGFLLGLNMAIVAVFWGGGALFSVWIEGAIKLPYYPYIPIVGITTLATAFYSVLMVSIQVSERPRTFAAAQIVRFGITAVVTLVMLIWARAGALGVLIGELAGSALVACALVVMQWKVLMPEPSGGPGGALRFDAGMLRKTIWYGAPFIAVSLCGWLMGGLDRIVLAMYREMSDVGIYSFSSSLSQGLKIVITAANAAYLPFFMRLASMNEGARDVFGHTGDLYATVLGTACAAGMLFAKEVVALIAPPEYHSAHAVVSLLLASVYFIGIQSLVVLPIMHVKKTALLPWIIAIAGVANVALSFSLIPIWGLWGAACSCLLSSMIFMGVTLGAAQRCYKVGYGTLGFWGVTVFVPVCGAVASHMPLWARITAFAGAAAAGFALAVYAKRNVSASLQERS